MSAEAEHLQSAVSRMRAMLGMSDGSGGQYEQRERGRQHYAESPLGAQAKDNTNQQFAWR
jgi:hypothetical protein